MERQFEIIGEALNQRSKIDADIINMLSDYRKIIAFRNILIHGYAEIDNRLVWDIIKTKLPTLMQELDNLLAHN